MGEEERSPRVPPLTCGWTIVDVDSGADPKYTAAANCDFPVQDRLLAEFAER